jgi:hypothetical protein
VHGFNEAAGDRQSETGAGADLIAFFDPIELVEDVLQLRRRNAVAFIQDLQADGIPVAPALDADRCGN